ncbi:DUF2318 domain-containing protein [Halapricum desulfuricans]|uniref:DUF2318 domain-containing protein n=1 Tax=Halapricum desulfuricans TaxID=2841257 RepID=UPI001E3ECFB9|nr:DUF2318 domain-containing protein [Halapricum desulfuricans]
MPTTDKTRADKSEVTEILSTAEAVTLPRKEDSVPVSITPEKVEKMDFPLAWLQEVEWEVYPGYYGPHTLLKQVEHGTSTCDECGGEGWYDHHGDIICNTCGMVLNRTPLIVPEDEFNDRAGDPSGNGGHYTFFNPGVVPALNTNMTNGADSEPDVQH